MPANNQFPFDTPPPGGPEFKPAAQVNFKPDLSVTRLVVGGLLSGMDALLDRLLTWEVMRMRSRGVDIPVSGDQPAAEGESGEPVVPLLHYRYDQRFENTRYAIVGLVFVIRQGLLEGADRLDRLQRRVTRRIPFSQPSHRQNFVARTISTRLDDLARRGEHEINRLIQIGRMEGDISRNLVDIAVYNTVDDSLEYLADNPEVKELVQTQSTGLADEFVEEIRERTVSADNFVEGIVRYILRRPARLDIPPPPPEVRARAERLHPEKYNNKDQT